MSPTKLSRNTPLHTAGISLTLHSIGSTGYIGGDALYALATTHQEYQITALVRDTSKGALLTSQYPSLTLVYGTLDDSELLTREAAAADIVLHCAHADHAGAAAAIVAGLHSKKEAAGYYIHTSGTGILCFGDLKAGRFGDADDKVYNDWEGVGEVTSLPDDAPHRNVDKIVLAAGGEGVKTAIVCPPCIYGPGRGPGNTRSMQAYEMAKVTLQRGVGVKVGKGEVQWTMVHVQDLSNLYVRLIEEAVKGGGSATWGSEGYYFAESGDFAWGDVAATIAKETKKRGLTKSADVESLTAAEAEKASPYMSFLWGTNSRARAIRARKVLAWEPKQRSLFDEVPDIVEGEAKALGLIKSHVEKAAGT